MFKFEFANRAFTVREFNCIAPLQHWKQKENYNVNHQSTAARKLRNIQLAAIGASSLLIVAFVGASIALGGLSSIASGNIIYGLAFWLAAGVIAGLALGKMNAVVWTANHGGSVSARSGFDDMLLSMTCIPLSGGRFVQTQIVNLLTGVFGLAVVYGICQLIAALSGITLFATFPGGLLYIFPLVIAWKLVENRSTAAMIKASR